MDKVLFAGLVADLIGNGHLQGPPKWRMDYCSRDEIELERFKKDISNLFGYEGRIRPNRTNKLGISFNLGINNRVIAKKFFAAGVPAGRKTKQCFLIPEWIKQDKECMREFLKPFI
jgi:hypothetical protein